MLAHGGGRKGERLAEYMEREATGGEEPRDDIALLVIEPIGVPAASVVPGLTDAVPPLH
jgi:hypothetical protein